MENIMIGIDLGGTNLRIGAVTPDNKMKNSTMIKSSIIANADKPIEMLCEIIEEYMQKTGIKKAEAISIGVPSSVANDKETVICTTNIRNSKKEVVFLNINIAADIRTHFQIPVYVNNDVNNILLYDVANNHLEEKKIVIGIYIGTGVGASVMINGETLEGKDGAALDLGHIPYYGGEIKCRCGKMGCCECYASGWQLQKIRKKYYPDTKIEDLFTLHKEEEPMKVFIASCAHVYAIMATIFNPDSLIVGGGVMEMKDFPKKEFEQAVNENTGKDVMSYGFDYIYSKEFQGKGVIGAAIFARKQMKKKT